MNLTFRFLSPFLLVFSLHSAPGVYRIETVAGGSNVGDGGPALHAPLGDAEGLAIDRAGNIYIADALDHRVRKITPAGTVSTVAGTGIAGFSGDDGPADRAQLSSPYSVSVDPTGALYIADLGNNRVRRVSPTGLITTVNATFRAPRNVLADAQGNVYVSEFDANRVRRINLDGTVTLIAGTGARGRSGDYGPATLATLNSPAGLALDASGALYIADSGNSQVRKVAGGMITTVLGDGTPGSSTPAQLYLPTGVALDAFGSLYVADSENHRVRKLSAAGTVSTVTVPARDLAFDKSGNLLVAYTDHVTKVLVSGAVAVVAGDGSYLFRGDSGLATDARLHAPGAVAVAPDGTLAVADTGNSRIRGVSANGVISTLTGPAPLRAPVALGFEKQGSLLLADPSSALIWKFLNPALFPAAGNGFPNFGGDGYSALSSSLSLPSGIAPIPNGGFYIADTGNHRIRRVNQGGNMSTVAGFDSGGWNGDGIALGASLNGPTALALTSTGVLYIADTGNNRIRKLTTDGQLTTVAGGSKTGLALNHPRGLALDVNETLWIADTGNNRLLTLTREGALTIAAGTGSAGFSGDGAEALAAKLDSPSGLAADSLGNIYIADTGNNRIRILIAPPAPLSEATSPGFSVVSAASLQGGAVAPCSLITIFGPNVNTLPVLFDGTPGAPVASAADQATLQVPCSATPPFVTLEAGSAWRYKLPVAIAAPSIFALNAGSGQALALNADNTPNSEANPAARGSLFTLYATGMGMATNPAGVIVGQTPAELLFSGDAPGLIGITQINIRLPPEATGVQPVLVLSANVASVSSVTIAISVN
jgi:uncharacterized protein (TIGR03437 family)